MPNTGLCSCTWTSYPWTFTVFRNSAASSEHEWPHEACSSVRFNAMVLKRTKAGGCTPRSRNSPQAGGASTRGQRRALPGICGHALERPSTRRGTGVQQSDEWQRNPPSLPVSGSLSTEVLAGDEHLLRGLLELAAEKPPKRRDRAPRHEAWQPHGGDCPWQSPLKNRGCIIDWECTAELDHF